ncbi:MAG TPA: POTRA domain-containing protein, partial [Acidobacteriaceae bacterium]|nr:POTRA domain-containing protein [Acidobacteriaceae bacterium]
MRGYLPVLKASWERVGVSLGLLLGLSVGVGFSIPAIAQSGNSPSPNAASQAGQEPPDSEQRTLEPVAFLPDFPQGNLAAWAGLRVVRVQFEGVPASTLQPLPDQLAQQPDKPLDPAKIRDSLRRLYATGLYQTIQVAGFREGGGITLVFSGDPRLFIRRVNVAGVNNDRLAAVLQSSTQLEPGTRYSPSRVTEANAALAEALQNNGYYKGKVAGSTSIDEPDSLVDLNYNVTTGPSARVGDIHIQGNSGLTEREFRKRAKLKRNSKVTRDTINRALTRLRKNYVKKERLAATISVTSKQYAAAQNRLNFDFLAQEGPIVTVRVEGAKISKGQIQKLVPVYEEGTVDLDLLNEGAQNLRSYYQSQGYFDVQVAHRPVRTDPQHVTVLYTVNLGALHVVDSVQVTGNAYFSRALIDQRISVRPADLVDRHGSFSQQLMNQDAGNIKALYESNGFSHATVTPKVIDLGRGHEGSGKLAHLKVIYQIQEGVQQRIGKYQIMGATDAQIAEFKPYLNTEPGQPYSAVNIDDDRDLVLTYYLRHGYDNAEINLFQEAEEGHEDLVDVTMNVTQGHQFFVRKI